MNGAVAAIHQFVPSFSTRDAIGGHVVQVREVLRGMGVASDIYVHEVRPDLRRQTRSYRDWTGPVAGQPTWLLYQCSTGSVMAEWLLGRPESKLSNYHNITPAEFFDPWEPHVGAQLEVARRQLSLLAPATELALADSAYNQSELDRLGYAETAVVPILVDLDALVAELDHRALDRLRRTKDRRGGGADWLFVGRMAPNKCQHDVVKAFAAYRRFHDPKARLHLVGGSSSHAYSTAIERYVAALGLADAVELAGSVPPGELAARFEVADVFVCLSEHEGFCVPLLEAMQHRVPIVAFAAGAVPETLAGAGLLLDDKTPATVAAAVYRVTSDPALATRLVEAGIERLRHFELAMGRARWAGAIEPLLGGDGVAVARLDEARSLQGSNSEGYVDAMHAGGLGARAHG
jgi:L-malate glycosyltransferase